MFAQYRKNRTALVNMGLREEREEDGHASAKHTVMMFPIITLCEGQGDRNRG